MKKINVYYIYLFYDISEKRVNKVFKICKKYLNHVQNSVFKGEISPSRLISLENEIKHVINKNEDKVTILNFQSKSYLNEVELGFKNNDSNFL